MSWWAWVLLGWGCLAALWAVFVVWLYSAGHRADARALATIVPDCAVLVSRLLRDERVSRRQKLLLVGLAGYLAFPLDLVPDVVPVAGQIDDVVLVALVLRHLVRASGSSLVSELWPGPERSLEILLRAMQTRPI